MKRIVKNTEELGNLSQKFYSGFGEKEDIVTWNENLYKMQNELIRVRSHAINTYELNFLAKIEEIQMQYIYYQGVFKNYLVIYHPNHKDLKNIVNLLEYKIEMFKSMAYSLLYESVTFLNQSKTVEANELIIKISEIIDLDSSNKRAIMTRLHSEAYPIHELAKILCEVRKHLPSGGIELWHETLAFCLSGLYGDV
ncbi:hypothetical protein [Bacillus thuringiensis]|uniref:hypothetical protein n=1 Tax=Bacillus thuringiensis TaxID=1428 RepID=UPI001EDDF87B|nr:hypothetical protein [Bacillus thuringiensis]MEB9694871.1 hypothetical protein [Bacillus cereus]